MKVQKTTENTNNYLNNWYKAYLYILVWILFSINTSIVLYCKIQTSSRRICGNRKHIVRTEWPEKEYKYRLSQQIFQKSGHRPAKMHRNNPFKMGRRDIPRDSSWRSWNEAASGTSFLPLYQFPARGNPIFTVPDAETEDKKQIGRVDGHSAQAALHSFYRQSFPTTGNMSLWSNAWASVQRQFSSTGHLFRQNVCPWQLGRQQDFHQTGNKCHPPYWQRKQQPGNLRNPEYQHTYRQQAPAEHYCKTECP